MRTKHAVHVASIAVLAFVLCSGFVCTGTQIHQAVVAEHDFKIAVQGFQSAELSEFQAGHIDPVLHQQIEGWIAQVGQGGSAITTLLQNSNGAGALAEINLVNTTMQTLLNQGVLQIKNSNTVTILQTSLLAVQAIITNIQTVLT